MMKKKRRQIAAAIIVFSVFAEIFFVCAAVYFSQKLPRFNNFVSSLLAKKPDKVAEPVEEETPPPPPNVPKITGIVPRIVENDTVVPLDEMQQEYVENGFLLKMIDEKSFSVSGDFRALQGDVADAGNAQNSKWTYSHDSKILSRPAFFADCAVFVDAKQMISIVDLKTGTLKNRHSCGVLPAGPAKISDSSYVFDAKNGDRYSAEFGEGNQRVERRQGAMQAFRPSSVALASLFSSLQKWKKIDSNDATVLFASAKILSEDIPEQISAGDRPQILIFGSRDAASFEFCVEKSNGESLQKSAFIAVFDESAGLVATSIEEASDSPSVVCEIQPNCIYYVVSGLLATLDDAAGGIFVSPRKSN